MVCANDDRLDILRPMKSPATPQVRAHALLTGGFLTVADVAAELRVCKSFVTKLCARGELAFVRVGADRRIPRAALTAYLEARLVAKDAA